MLISRRSSALVEGTLVSIFSKLIFQLGAAYLVKQKSDNKSYIAKKILLGQL